MKRRLSFALALILLLSLLSACGGGGQSGPVALTIWHDKEDAVVAVLQAELDKLAPDVVVKLEKKNGLTEALKMVGNDPNSAPDLYFFAHDKLGVYAEMGILTPITELVDEALLDDYIGMTISAATYKGEVYQLPIYFETLLFMYNRALMDDADVPATTEELYAHMQEYTKGGVFGFVEQHSTAYYSAGWIHGFGGEIIAADGTPGLDSPETVAALAYHKKFVDLMPGETEYATVNTLFREGKAHATIGGPWLIPTVRKSGIDVGMAPMPTVDATGLPIAPYSGVQGLHVLKVAADNKEKREAIAKLLTQITSVELGAEMAAASGCAPANARCYDLDAVKNDDTVMMMRTVAESAVPMPNIPEMDVMWNVAGNLLVDINMRGVDVETAASDAQRKAEELIAAMR